MSKFTAAFFNYMQGAAFYRELHDNAVHILPAGNGDAWFDVGSGPGLVARLAASRGYLVTGFDIDPTMVNQAYKNAKREDLKAVYEVSGLNALVASGRKASVVSSASLLTVLTDKDVALNQLLSCLDNNGVMLIIETTDAMNPNAPPTLHILTNSEARLVRQGTTGLQAPYSTIDEAVLGFRHATSTGGTAALYSGLDELLWSFGVLPAITRYG